MELTPKQQIVELIKDAQGILIVTHDHPDGDAIGSAHALTHVLTKIGKEVTLRLPKNVSGVYQFLTLQDQAGAEFKGARDFIITLDTRETEVEKLGYRTSTQEHKVSIVVTPKRGTFQPENVSFSWGKQLYDLVIVLDTPTIERLGSVYNDHAALFYETPVINIDHHASNDHFGRVNWVELTATSTAEMLVSLIESLAAVFSKTRSGEPTNLFTESIATCLLTGIISDTGSFQYINTTPKSLTVAAQLVAAGARQHDIITHLYKMKPLSTLQLWGKILTRVEVANDQTIAYSYVKATEVKETGSDWQAVDSLIDELLKSITDVSMVALFSERNHAIHANLRSIDQSIDVSVLARRFGGGGHAPAAAFEVPIDQSFEEDLVNILAQLNEEYHQRFGQ